MKIAVTSENNQIFQHFGKCPSFTVYEITGENSTKPTIINTNGSGHSALAVLLSANKIDLLICGGIGQGAKDALAANGIKLICGVTGDVDAAVQQYLQGLPLGDPDFVCNHHQGEHNCH